MSYRVDRSVGYQKAGVINPWVFANYGQPQRHRGYVSPIVYQGQPPGMRFRPLGDESSDRAARMERYTLIGLTLSAVSLGMFAYHLFKQRAVRNRVTANKRRGGRSRRRTRRNAGGRKVPSLRALDERYDALVDVNSSDRRAWDALLADLRTLFDTLPGKELPLWEQPLKVRQVRNMIAMGTEFRDMWA